MCLLFPYSNALCTSPSLIVSRNVMRSKNGLIEEMKKKRFQFLHKLYEMAEGTQRASFNMYEIGKKVGFDEELTKNIAEYLMAEGLIESRAIGGGRVAITHQGTCEVEDALSYPDTPTTHFPSHNIIIGPVIKSQIQIDSPQAIQKGIIGDDKYKELKEVIQSLKESIDQLGLTPQEKSIFQTDIQTMEAQISSSKPNATIITGCVGSITRILKEHQVVCLHLGSLKP